MRHIKTVAACCLAVSMACQIPVYAQMPEGYDAETWERLNDNRLEYNEIEDRIVHFSTAYQAATQQMESAFNYAAYEQAAVDMRTAADEMIDDMEQEIERTKKDKKDRDENPPKNDDWNDDEEKSEREYGYQATLMTLSRTISGTRSGAKSMEKAVESMRRAIDRNLDTSVKGPMSMAVESLMSSYQRLTYATELVDASVELAQASYDSTVTQQSIGMATADDVVAAQESLVSARSQQESTRYQLSQVKQNIYMMTGWEHDANVEIGSIPEPDQNRIAGMDPEADVEKAIGNNVTLSGMRRSGSNGMSVAQKRSRLEQMEEMEEKIKLGINQSYQNVLQNQTAFQAASAAYESANLTYAASQRQYQLGLVSALQYRQLTVAYLSQKMNYENAMLDFFQAMEDYDWAVKGQLSLE